MKVAARLAELQAKPDLSRAELSELRELHKRQRWNEKCRARYASDPSYRKRLIDRYYDRKVRSILG